MFGSSCRNRSFLDVFQAAAKHRFRALAMVDGFYQVSRKPPLRACFSNVTLIFNLR